MADKDYTKFDNEYFTFLSQLDFNGSEFKVLLFLLRYSACFKRDYTNPCAASFIGEGIGMSERQVKRILNKFLKEGYIYNDYEHSSKKGHSYFISSDKLGQMKGQKWYKRGVKDVPSTIPKMSHKENTEDNSKENTEKKRKASPHSYPNYPAVEYTVEELYAWKDVMSEEDFEEFKRGKVWS